MTLGGCFLEGDSFQLTGGDAMEYITLNDLVQIGIFLTGFTMMIIRIISFFHKKK